MHRNTSKFVLYIGIILCVGFSPALGQTMNPPHVTPCYDTVTFGMKALDTDSFYIVKLFPDNYSKTATFFLSRPNFIQFHTVEKVDSIIGQNHFTCIQFRMANDTGTHRMRTVVLCIAKGKLHTSLDFFSHQFGSPERLTDTIDYQVSTEISMAGGKPSLILHESRITHLPHDTIPKDSFSKVYNLTFDSDNYIFYDSAITLANPMTLVSSTDTTKISEGTKLPSLKLWYPERYYFANDRWYIEIPDATNLKARE